MPDSETIDASDDVSYQEREAVAVFDDELSLNTAVYELIQLGLKREDMSLVARQDKLSPLAFETAASLEDADNVPHAAYASPHSRSEGLAALVSGPAVIAGLGAAAIIGTGGGALLPTLSVAVGSTLAGGSLGLLMARAFGRKHAAYVETQILSGGLLLWVHAPEGNRDAEIIDILRRNSGRDVHFHIVNRRWGIADIPLHDFNPDPLLKA